MGRIRKGIVRAFKALSFTLLALVLTMFGFTVCVVNVLSPAKLTQVCEYAANRMLEADVSIGRMELTMRATFPYLTLDVDSVLVVSRSLDGMSAEQRELLPVYADTLLSLGNFHGGVNVAALLLGRIDLRDVTFTAPAINIVVGPDGYNNFNIYNGRSNDKEDRGLELPELSINRFRIADPRDFRFYDAVSGTWGELAMQTIDVEGVDTPRYTLDFKGNVFSSWFDDLALDSLPFDFEGGIRWSPQMPYVVEINDFRASVAFVDMAIDTSIDFENDLVVNSAHIAVSPVAVSDVLGLVPDSLMRSYGVKQQIVTDAVVGLDVKLDAPYNTSTTAVPDATLTLDMPDCSLSYGKAKLDDLALRVVVLLRDNDLNATLLRVENLHAAGPMTELTLTGEATDLLGDPLLTGCLKGNFKLDRMPGELRQLLHGYVAGVVDADVDFSMRPSMFTRNNFHKLQIAGDIDGHRLYWLGSDTTSMGYVNDLCLKFGTNESVSDGVRKADNLLAAFLEIDSANILHHQYEFKGTKLSLNVGVQNKQRSGVDTMAIVPVGGGLRVGTFALHLLTDSTTVRTRDLAGRVGMRPYQGDGRRPEFVFDLGVGHISTGNPLSRIMISGAKIRFDAHKLPANPRRAAVRRTVDSLRRVYPDLPPDSVYSLADKRYSKRTHHRRVQETVNADSLEIINWGTSSQLRHLLLDWKLGGSLTAKRGIIFTPYFPVRNRLKNINLAFDNDSIYFENIALKAGHSDVLASGRVTNLAVGLTSRGGRIPLKLNFEVLSDTIDVNQLASLVFRGGAFAQDKALRKRMSDAVVDDDVNNIDRDLEDMIHQRPDTALSPLLVPTNVEAEINIRANNILYSDLRLKDMQGQALLYGGALNLHKLSATSDVGSVNLTALYSAPSVSNMHFGFGLNVDKFCIDKFLSLVPALDTIMPVLRDFSGEINADVAATADIDRHMDLVLPSINAVVKIEGDSLRLLDASTYRTLAKWLMFKDKQRNIIDHLSVEALIEDNVMRVYPFVFDFDRYRIGLQGYNTLAMDFDYHVSVLKSPLPFKFGINLSGTPENVKVRLGRARLRENIATQRISVADTTRINLLKQIENVFRRGVENSEFARLQVSQRPEAAKIDLAADTISAADSLYFIREGLIPAPVVDTVPAPTTKNKKKRRLW